MTDAVKLTKIKQILGITDTDSDALLNTYLELGWKEYISWKYGDSKYPNILNVEDSEEAIVTVFADMFIAVISPVSGTTYTFTYSETNESWQYGGSDVDLADYGITYEENVTPVDAETITVTYNENYMRGFDATHIMAVVAGFSIRGAEGQTDHAENGVNRTFKYEDMISYIHSHVAPIVKVI